MRFSDLHNHNHSRSYLWLKPNEKHHRKKEEFHPWTIISPNLRAERNAKGSAAAYGQCDLVKLWNGGVRLTFNSMYSMEKGFFQTASKAAEGKNRFLREIVRTITSDDLPLRDLMQMFYMRIPDKMIDHLQSKSYDYWDWFQDEYKFIISKSGERVTNQIISPGLLRKIFENRKNRRNLYPNSLDATGIYQIPKSNKELTDLLKQDVITMVLTIEGAHCFGSDIASYDVIEKRLIDFKKKNPYPIFFLTFAHHFDNRLCGHAKSLPDLGKFFLNQDTGKNGPFTPNGRKFLRRVLALEPNSSSLDSKNIPDLTNGYRILIDVKHMSARSRKEFYLLVEERLNANDIIPVIASHCGYSGIKTLQEMMNNEPKEKDDYFDSSQLYNAWNINVCDEDIKIIFRTKGLFGLSFDQRIIGVPKSQKTPGGRNSIVGLWSSIKGVLNVIYNDNQFSVTKNEMWNRISIGTDNEGFIDPVNKYATVLQFEIFQQDLITAIEAERKSANPSPCVKDFVNVKQVKEVVERLCFKNAEDFVRLHYPI